jgi:hypothetical protein
VTLAPAVAIVVYAAVADDRLPGVIAGIGAAGCALTAVALVARRPSVLAPGLAGVGGAYGLFLGLRGGAVDVRAPLVAAGLFLAAEVGFAALAAGPARAERGVVVRAVARLAGGVVGAALVGSLLLVATTGVGGSVALEAAGVAAAVLTLAAIAALASRASV